MTNIPEKEFYRLNEVCQYTDTQPYVLRFWESEFPQLSPERRGGSSSVYRKEDLELICRIKELLHEEEYTLSAARKLLDDESAGKSRGKKRSGAGSRDAKKKQAAEPRPAPEPAPAPHGEDPPNRILPFQAAAPEADASPPTVDRQRYQDAVDEIEHLRLKLREAERAREKAEAAAEGHRRLRERAAERVERLLEHLAESDEPR